MRGIFVALIVSLLCLSMLSSFAPQAEGAATPRFECSDVRTVLANNDYAYFQDQGNVRVQYGLNQTRRMVAETHVVNRLNACRLDVEPIPSTLARSHVVGEAYWEVWWDMRVWRRMANGTEIEITSGTPVAIIHNDFPTGLFTLRSATWNCPATQLANSDSIVVCIYEKGYNCANFTTEVLGTTRLDAATWTVYYYVRWYVDYHNWYYAEFMWGYTCPSRIENFQYSTTPTPALSFALIPNPAYVSQTVTMFGNLTDGLGQPIDYAIIDLYVNGAYSGTIYTNSTGWLNASAKVNTAGTYNVTAVCNLENYNASHTEFLVVNSKLNTNVWFVLTPNPVHVGQSVLMTGNLSDINFDPIGNAPLELYVKTGVGPWQYIGNISTDPYGGITAFGKVTSTGTYQVAIVYRGSYKYNLSYHIETLVVNS